MGAESHYLVQQLELIENGENSITSISIHQKMSCFINLQIHLRYEPSRKLHF